MNIRFDETKISLLVNRKIRSQFKFMLNFNISISKKFDEIKCYKKKKQQLELYMNTKKGGSQKENLKIYNKTRVFFFSFVITRFPKKREKYIYKKKKKKKMDRFSQRKVYGYLKCWCS